MLKFWEDILHLLNWICLKFETNPMVDLRGTTILNKNLEACSWKSFHELYYNYLLHMISFHALCLHTFFFTNNIFSHIRTNSSLTHSFSSFLLCSLGLQKTRTIHTLGKPPMTLLWACSPCPMEASKSSPPINGLLILQEPMRIENDLPSNWF
jgi:hypothetical protein